uniref:Secreted protein n=1 Tax=Arundo donax TaxID=35708 RepID=A0A0A9AHF3_ARUDO
MIFIGYSLFSFLLLSLAMRNCMVTEQIIPSTKPDSNIKNETLIACLVSSLHPTYVQTSERHNSGSR